MLSNAESQTAPLARQSARSAASQNTKDGDVWNEQRKRNLTATQSDTHAHHLGWTPLSFLSVNRSCFDVAHSRMGP